MIFTKHREIVIVRYEETAGDRPAVAMVIRWFRLDVKVASSRQPAAG